MRLFQTVDDFISDDTDGTKPLLGNIDPSTELEKIDSFTKYSGDRLCVVAPNTESLSLGSLTTGGAKGIWLRANGDLDIVFNGGVEVFELRKQLTATYARVHLDINITAVSVTHTGASGATDIILDFRFWG